ncbi:hypothetical protein PILCRDRAFT_438 [Piloderma croceum F 1598]|uniref:Uncharacterized protein n=1 Tax=Piloderma croceum (strain F 1598) TaxID=765440 RepID=A0A0C3C0N3_PILCF|nr:hypothetical protein PILCRDRAFT_438 [Piloderma croceum F 1598]
MLAVDNSAPTNLDTTGTSQLPPSVMALLAAGTAIQLLLLIMYAIAMLREKPEPPLYAKRLLDDLEEAAADAST